ncbi:hypothetical protein [Streptomyces sp. NBC_01314]|uniref:hypothetical protein n=1 Tax=Streptomyces sp. NBC_01314 TaxID=2903821 RepID=UPI0030862543|nr:hypothetical protein OG622_18755 [Streptomyces sp. NBC_01314]
MARHAAPQTSGARRALLAVTTAAADGAAPVVDVLRTRPTSLGQVDPQADFQPLTSTALTGPVAQAPSIGSIPVVGSVVGGLKG